MTPKLEASSASDTLPMSPGILKHFVQLLGKDDPKRRSELAQLIGEIDAASIAQPPPEEIKSIHLQGVADQWFDVANEYPIMETRYRRSPQQWAEYQQSAWDTLTKPKLWIWDTYTQQKEWNTDPQRGRRPQLPRLATFTKRTGTSPVHYIPMIACLYGVQVLRGLGWHGDMYYTMWYNYTSPWSDTGNTMLAPVILIGRDLRYTAQDIEMANHISGANLGPIWNSAYGAKDAFVPRDFHDLIIVAGAARKQY